MPSRENLLRAARLSALRHGLGEDGALVAQAILLTEGAMDGQVGDSGASHGPYQFHRDGMLPAYAKHLGVPVEEAERRVVRDPIRAIDWALKGYLGQAIKEGKAKGLSGPELATYAQQNGQRSQTPERAGLVYRQHIPELRRLSNSGVLPRQNVAATTQTVADDDDSDLTPRKVTTAAAPPASPAMDPVIASVIRRKGQPISVIPKDPWESGDPKGSVWVLTFRDNTSLEIDTQDEGKKPTPDLIGAVPLRGNALPEKQADGRGAISAPPNHKFIIYSDGTKEENPNYQAPAPESMTAGNVRYEKIDGQWTPVFDANPRPDPDAVALEKRGRTADVEGKEADTKRKIILADADLATQQARARATAAWKQFGDDRDYDKLAAALDDVGEGLKVIGLKLSFAQEKRLNEGMAQSERHFAATQGRLIQDAAQRAGDSAVSAELALAKMRVGPTFRAEAERVAQERAAGNMKARMSPTAFVFKAPDFETIRAQAVANALKGYSPYAAQIAAGQAPAPAAAAPTTGVRSPDLIPGVEDQPPISGLRFVPPSVREAPPAMY